METRPLARSNRAAFISFLGLALASSILVGEKALTQHNQADACPTPHPLEKVSLEPHQNILNPSGVEAINEGDCAAVYDRNSQKRLTTIATGEMFTVICSDIEPNSFEVAVSEDAAGFVDYANDFKVVDGQTGNEPLIPSC